MRKKLFSNHVNLDSFIPATEADKEYMVQMRPSSTFFKDTLLEKAILGPADNIKAFKRDDLMNYKNKYYKNYCDRIKK